MFFLLKKFTSIVKYLSLITKVCVVEVDETDVDNMTISNNVAFTNKIAV